MRLGLVFLGLLSPLACTLPNPAYHVTDGYFESSSSGSTAGTGSASNSSTVSTSAGPTTASSGMTATSDQPTSSSGPTTQTTGTTDPGDHTETDATLTATSSPMTSTTDVTASTSTTGPDSSSTSLSTTGPDSTSTTLQPADLANMDFCPLVAGPMLALSVQHVPAPATCNAPLGPVFHGVYKGKADADSLVFRECLSFTECKAKNGNCVEKQTVTVNVAGPATHIPVFEPNECVNISYIGVGYADNNTCNTQVVRLGRLDANVLTTSVFVGAVAVPDTGALPAPWPDVLEFSVAPSLLESCGPGTVCGQVLGDYQLVGHFDGATVMVPHQSEKPVKVPLLDQNQNKVGDIPGSLYNLRSWSNPDNCDFQWIFLADDNKPG